MLILSIGSVCISKASKRLTSNFSVVSLYVACLLARIASSTNHYNIRLRSESITGQSASKLAVMMKLPGSSRTVVFVRRTQVFARTILEHYSQTMFTKTVRLLTTGLTRKMSVVWGLCRWEFYFYATVPYCGLFAEDVFTRRVVFRSHFDGGTTASKLPSPGTSSTARP